MEGEEKDSNYMHMFQMRMYVTFDLGLRVIDYKLLNQLLTNIVTSIMIID